MWSNLGKLTILWWVAELCSVSSNVHVPKSGKLRYLCINVCSDWIGWSDGIVKLGPVESSWDQCIIFFRNVRTSIYVKVDLRSAYVLVDINFVENF